MLLHDYSAVYSNIMLIDQSPVRQAFETIAITVVQIHPPPMLTNNYWVKRVTGQMCTTLARTVMTVVSLLSVSIRSSCFGMACTLT